MIIARLVEALTKLEADRRQWEITREADRRLWEIERLESEHRFAEDWNVGLRDRLDEMKRHLEYIANYCNMKWGEH